METQALVARGPLSEGKWAIEDVRLRTLKEDEVVVEIVASGICHTDLHCGDTRDDKGVPAVFYPRVLGHEVGSIPGGRLCMKIRISLSPADPLYRAQDMSARLAKV